MTKEVLPLYNLEAEMSTLGAMILKEQASEQVFGLLEDSDFYFPAHREIYRAMRQLSIQFKAIDLITLKNELETRQRLEESGGEDYLIQIAESVPSAANATYYAGIVKDKSILRNLNTVGHEIVKLTQDPDNDVDEKLNDAENLVFQVGNQRLGQDFIPARSLAKEFVISMDNLYESGEPILGMPSGFYDLDDMTTGFYPGDLTILAARPSMGKSSLALKFALNAARKHPEKNVAFFCLEMSGEQMVRRLVSMIASVNSNVLKRRDLSQEHYRKLANACETIYDLPIYFDESSDISGLEMRGKCRRLQREGGLSLVVVDYLQLMRGSKRTENRVQEVSEIARSLKAMSKELKVPVIALSQLSRSVESRENKRPQLSDLRESGSIEAEADLVMFIYRDNYYMLREKPEEADDDPDRTEVAEIIISKHRNGPVGTVKVAFQPKYALYENLAR